VVMLTLVAFVSGAIAAAPPKAATTAPAPAAPASTEPAKHAKMETFSGHIKSVDAMAKSIVVVERKVEKTFMVDEKAKIREGNENLPFADLKAGMYVHVYYKVEGGKMIAMGIQAAALRAAPKAATTGK